MAGIIPIPDANQAVEILGVKLLGVTAENGKKLLFTLVFVLLLLLLGRLLSALAVWRLRAHRNTRLEFWTHQSIRLAVTLVLLLGVVSIWFDDPGRLATGVGLVTAGLAFALQKVISAVAGYFVILQGKTFNVGDRISMGGVRGDVIALDLIKTTIMEMGQPDTYADASSPTWVRSRQYTGRVVTVSNDKVFSEPVYNYSRDFPYIWEEMSLPITYTADRQRAEQILLEAAGRHTVRVSEVSRRGAAGNGRLFTSWLWVICSRKSTIA